MTVADVERLTAIAEGESALAMSMTEEAFRSFYDRTARSVWGYLARLTGDPALADDLLQDAYYRFLRAGGQYENEAHRRNSLFKIAESKNLQDLEYLGKNLRVDVVVNKYWLLEKIEGMKKKKT